MKGALESNSAAEVDCLIDVLADSTDALEMQVKLTTEEQSNMAEFSARLEKLIAGRGF